MSQRHVIAVLVALSAIMLALVPPLWIRTTGDEVALALQPVDPLSLFRGNYVDLQYMRINPPRSTESGDTVFVVFDDTRPAGVVRVETSRPELGDGETCLRGKVGWDSVTFPELEQYFVTSDEGRDLERQLSDMVGVVRTTGSCRGVLVNIEAR